jgi:copper chaperone CopZ
MTTLKIFVENIKYIGCINSIKTSLLKIKGVIDVNIFKGENKICITGVAVEREEMVTKLAFLGYPEKGNNSLFSKAESFISCVMGRVS